MKIYAFLYNSSTEESSYATMSLHRSKEGAEKAMNEHKETEYKKWKAMEKKYKGASFFGMWQDWAVEEMEVLD